MVCVQNNEFIVPLRRQDPAVEKQIKSKYNSALRVAAGRDVLKELVSLTI